MAIIRWVLQIQTESRGAHCRAGISSNERTAVRTWGETNRQPLLAPASQLLGRPFDKIMLLFVQPISDVQQLIPQQVYRLLHLNTAAVGTKCKSESGKIDLDLIGLSLNSQLLLPATIFVQAKPGTSLLLTHFKIIADSK